MYIEQMVVVLCKVAEIATACRGGADVDFALGDVFPY